MVVVVCVCGEGGGLPDLGRAVRHDLTLPGPGRRLSAWSVAVVVLRGQDRSDRPTTSVVVAAFSARRSHPRREHPSSWTLPRLHPCANQTLGPRTWAGGGTNNLAVVAFVTVVAVVVRLVSCVAPLCFQWEREGQFRLA